MSALLVFLLGGVVGLDSTSFPQAMISRPIVAATLAGAALGRPADGAVLGLLLEVFALVVLPVGASRYPEAGPAAVAAGSAYAAVAGAGAVPVLLAALVAGLLLEWIGAYSVVLLRRFNERYVALPAERRSIGPAALEQRHLDAMLVDFLRGGALAAGGFLALQPLLAAAGREWSWDSTVGHGTVTVAAVGMLAATFTLFRGGRERLLLLGGGLVIGSAVAWW